MQYFLNDNVPIESYLDQAVIMKIKNVKKIKKNYFHSKFLSHVKYYQKTHRFDLTKVKKLNVRVLI